MDDIVRDVHNQQHVVAVAGIGVSLNSTIAEVTQLTAKDNIPVVGSSMTSEALNNIRNMVRVVPDNDQEISALLKRIWPSDMMPC